MPAVAVAVVTVKVITEDHRHRTAGAGFISGHHPAVTAPDQLTLVPLLSYLVTNSLDIALDTPNKYFEKSNLTTMLSKVDI